MGGVAANGSSAIVGNVDWKLEKEVGSQKTFADCAGADIGPEGAKPVAEGGENCSGVNANGEASGA